MPSHRLLKSLTIAVVAATSVARAEAAPPEGCFERVYPKQHLAEHPKQTVRHLIVSVGWDDEISQNMFGMKAWLRGKRQEWRAGGSCQGRADAWICQPDTDGAPQVSAVMRGDALEFSNPKRLKVYDMVTGPGLNEDWIDGPANATFLLARTNPAKCKSG